jgi:hypothetical protein
MSSTTGIQNLLVNVFRPVYSYEIPPGTSNTIFVPKLEMSNIDNYSGNSVSVFTAAVGDANSNVYVGSNAGNVYTTLKGCRFVTALGYSAAAGISNVSNSVFVGYNAGAGAAGANSNVIVGDNATGNGTSNVRIGSSNTGTGSSNVSVGTATSSSTYSNCILLGPGITATQDNQFRVGTSYLWGDQSNKWLGIGRPTSIDISYNALDVSGNVYVDGQVGINMVPTRTLDVNGNFRASDANGTLDFDNGVTSSSNGFASRRGTISNAGIGSTTSIATLKKGVILVSAQDTASTTSNFESAMVYCSDATDGTFTAFLSSNVQSGDVSVVFQLGGSNIQISNLTSVRSIDWSITYFPL